MTNQKIWLAKVSVWVSCGSPPDSCATAGAAAKTNATPASAMVDMRSIFLVTASLVPASRLGGQRACRSRPGAATKRRSTEENEEGDHQRENGDGFRHGEA